MTGVLRHGVYRIGGDTTVCSRTVTVSGDRHNIILIQIVKGQRTYTAPIRFAETDARRHRYDIGMYVRRRLDRTCFQRLIVHNVRTELVRHTVHGNCRAGGVRLSFGNLCRHADNGAAGRSPRPQLLRRVTAQVPHPGSIHLAVLQIFFILILFFAGNILTGHRHIAGSLDGLCAGNIAAVGILQLRVGQGTCRRNAPVRTGKTQTCRRIHLGQGVLAGHQHIGKTRVGSPLNAALDIVIDFADGRSHAGRDARSRLIRLDPGQIYAAGHLDITVISAVFQIRTACIGHIIGFSLIPGGCVYQQCVGSGVCLVHGQAERDAGIRTGPLAVIRQRQAQGHRGFRTVPDRSILNVACLGNPGRQYQRICVPVQVVDRQRGAQRAFFCIVVGSRPGCAGKPVHRRRAGPGPAEHIVRRRIDQGTRLVCFLLLAQIHIGAADDGRCFAVDFVPGHAGRRCGVEGRFRRVVVSRLHRVVVTKVPLLTELRIITGYRFKLFNREIHHILARVRQLVAQIGSLLIPVREKIKTGVTFRSLCALNPHGVQGSAAVPRHRNVIGCYHAFGSPCSCFCPQGIRQFLLCQLKLRVHPLHLRFRSRHFTGGGQGILRLDLVLLLRALFLKFVRVCIRHGRRRVRTGIADHGDAVHVQQVHRHPGAHRCVGTGTAQSQAADHIGYRSAAIGPHGKSACRLDRCFIVQQHQRVVPSRQQVQGTGHTQVLVRLACAQDDAGLDHFVFGVQGNVSAVLSGRIRCKRHIFPGQDQAVADKILYRHGGPGSIAVAFRHGKIFPAVAGGRHHIGIRQRINFNIFPGGNVRFFSQGYDTLIMQLGNVNGRRQVQIGGAVVLGIHYVAANIIVGIAFRAQGVR